MAAAQNFESEGGHPNSAVEITSKLLVQDGTVADLDAARTYHSDMGPAATREYLYSKSAEEIFQLFADKAFCRDGQYPGQLR